VSYRFHVHRAKPAYRYRLFKIGLGFDDVV
jgi:hypothetical protein